MLKGFNISKDALADPKRVEAGIRQLNVTVQTTKKQDSKVLFQCLHFYGNCWLAEV